MDLYDGVVGVGDYYDDEMDGEDMMGDDMLGRAAAPMFRANPKLRGGLLRLPARPGWRAQVAPGVQVPGQGLWPLPMSPETNNGVFDNANQSINYIARPQVPFRGERLIATISKSVGAQGITIRSMAGIIVGTTPQVADVGNMALEAFGANAFGVRLMLNQATPGMTIKIFAQASSPIPIGEQITVDLQILGRVIRA